MNKKIISVLLMMIVALFSVNLYASEGTAVQTQTESKEYHAKTLSELASSFYETTGINAILNPSDDVMTSESHSEDARPMTTFEQTWGRIIMFVIVGLLFYLAIAKGFEPLLLLPIAFGGLLANIPLAGIGGETGMLGIIYNMG